MRDEYRALEQRCIDVALGSNHKEQRNGCPMVFMAFQNKLCFIGQQPGQLVHWEAVGIEELIGGADTAVAVYIAMKRAREQHPRTEDIKSTIEKLKNAV